MTDQLKPLNHADADKKEDDQLTTEAASHLVETPACQLICELLTKLREMQLPWWTARHLRATYSASDRMRWLTQRPDLRQRITTQLTGLAPKAARKKAPDFQAALIDSVIDDGDISVEDFELSFEPGDMAVYGPIGDFWRLFRRRMPWDDDATSHQDLVGWLIGALLKDKSSLDGSPRKPVLDAWDVRTAIDGRVWHTRVPLDVRVAIDEARFKQQKDRPTEPFHASQDLLVATPALIAASLPLKDLVGVLDVAGRAMGFEQDETAARPSAAPAAPAAAAGEDSTMVGPSPSKDEMESTNPWAVPDVDGSGGRRRRRS